MKDKIINNTTFPYFLGFSALLIALCAAIFSVYGIGSLFAGASVSAMIMAGSLELGKLVATTFLYRYWQKTIGIVKTYLTIAVVLLMIITSAGIFGFLSAAYQQSSLNFKLTQEKIVNIEQSKGYYTNQIGISQERIKVLNETRKIQESRLSEALTNTFLVRNPIQLQQLQQQTIKLIDQANDDIKNENTKIEESRNKLQSIDENINQLKIGATEKKDIQTFKFVAEELNTDLDTVAKWFIISLIVVFDPLAIALILAYNVVVYKKEDVRIKEEDDTEKKTLDSEVKTNSVVEDKPINPIQNVSESEPIIQPVVYTPKNEITVEPSTTQIQIDSPIGHPPEMDDYYKRMFKQ
jgi:hypothetical protein